MPQFVPSWNFDYAVAAEGQMVSSGHYASAYAQAVKPRPAVSLGHLRQRYIEQGVAGVCYAASPVQLFEMTAKALGFQPFAASVRFTAWVAKQMEDRGNPADGGSPTSAVRAMTDRGAGVAPESTCPYPRLDNPDAMRAALAPRPPQQAFDEAKKTYLEVPIAVKSFDEIVSLIDGQNGKVPGLPVVNGFQCPVEMQSSLTFVKSISGFLGGHSETCTGFISPDVIDDSWWLEMENHWGLLYPPLPPSIAKQVVGYEPASKTRTSSNWIRRDVYIQCCQQGCEHVSATSIEGLLKNPNVVASDDLAKKIADIFIA